MVRLRGWQWLGWMAGAGLLLGPGRAAGQAGGGGARAVLVEMASRAGVIFAGQVMGIAREDDRGYVEVRFRVEVPVRGVERVGSGEYGVREWAGLWTGADRYRVGQSYLMLLLPRGASGLSGPVDGMDGAIPLIAAGGGTGMEMGVDLRWIEARAEREMLGSGVAGKGSGRGVRAEGRVLMGGVEGPIDAPERGGLGVGKSWSGAVAPLGSAGAGMKLEAVVALLQVGSGMVHEAR